MPFRPFSHPRAGQPAPIGPRVASDPAAPTSIGAAAIALVVLFLVLLSVFVYLSRLNQGTTLTPAADRPWTDGPPVVGISGTSAPDAPPEGRPGTTLGALAVSAAGGYQSLRDERWNYELMFPQGWRSAAAERSGTLLTQADHDRVVEDPQTGARMALSIWAASDDQPLEGWARRVAPGMQPTDGSWEANATVAGQPALALWSPESATRPGHYATLLLAGGRLHALSYAAHDGGASLADYAKALVSLRWLDSAEGADRPDQVPLFPMPSPRFYPSGRLFR